LSKDWREIPLKNKSAKARIDIGKAPSEPILIQDRKRGSYTVLPSDLPKVEAKKPHKLPFTSVYHNTRTGHYSVQPYVMGPVSWTEFGDPALIAPQDFTSKIAEAVLSALAKFGEGQFDRSRAIRRSAAEHRRFQKEHLGVSVRRTEGGDLSLHPLHREQGGMVGSQNDVIRVPPQDIPEKLAEAIAEAFKRAT
jgi:hypothetical protein